MNTGIRQTYCINWWQRDFRAHGRFYSCGPPYQQVCILGTEMQNYRYILNVRHVWGRYEALRSATERHRVLKW